MNSGYRHPTKKLTKILQVPKSYKLLGLFKKAIYAQTHTHCVCTCVENEWMMEKYKVPSYI
jgi:hypothetical protein